MRIPLLVIPLLLACQSSWAGLEKRIPAVEEYLNRLEKHGFAGAVLVAQGDQTLLASGYGMADREAGRPWTPQTVSTIGSITKQFTGAAILALAEDGRVAVTDPITKYFDDLPADKQAITLHQLLTHSSGIVDLEGVGDHDPIDRDEFIRRAMAQPLAFAPGEDYQYSNAGYSLLGAIIELVTHQSYEAFVHERFFVPAGMNDTGYILAGVTPDRLAQGYENGKKWGTVLERPMADDGPYWVLRANGGIHSTVEDMNRWARYLLDGKALSPASMKAYWSPHVDEGGGESYYGYGWVVMDQDGLHIITHNGGNGIHFADMMIVPDSGVVIVLQCNVLAEFPVANRLLEQIGGYLLLNHPLPEVPDIVPRSRADLESLAGTYRLENGVLIEATTTDSTLEISATDPEAFTALFSTRQGDPERARRLSERLDAIMTPWLTGDVESLWAAYGERVPRERLRASHDEAMAAWTTEYGALTGHRVLGTAFTDYDVTLLRIEFERGSVDRLYVWDVKEEGRLLGMSRAGLDPVLHVYPQADGSFASFEARRGESRKLRIEQANGEMQMRFTDGPRAVRTTQH